VSRKRKTAAERRHLDRVAQLRCLITDGFPVTLHHVRRCGMPRSHFQVLPIVDRQHLAEYEGSLEHGKESWEAKYGCQEYWLGVVDGLLGCYRERLDGRMPPVTR